MKRFFFWFIILLFLAAGAGGAVWYKDRGEKRVVSYRTAAVHRGELLATIKATGTIEPEEVVDVGAQVAGQILNFGMDLDGKAIDYGSQVDDKTILAKIDDSLYQTDFISAQAAVAQANAGVKRAEADLLQLKAKLTQADRDWDRAQKLGPSEALAQTSYDSYKAAYDIAVANVAVGEAEVVQAQSAIDAAGAALRRVQRNLDYCTIKSPVRGVIIDRRVNVGQTVVSSLNAPSLFLIAKDLKRMQLWVPVNEADIGHVHEGQPVMFTVDAFPNENFKGVVGKVRLNAVMTQNVVTFTVEVTTDNSSGRLLPYLTANVQFESGRRDNALLVPNAALRFTPRPEQVAQDAVAENDSAAPSGEGDAAPAPAPGGGRRGGRGGGATTQRAASSATPTHGTVWVSSPTGVRPIHVKLGIADDSMTEITSDNLPEGTEIVLGEQRADDVEAAGGTNPFAMQFGRRGGGGGGGRRGG